MFFIMKDLIGRQRDGDYLSCHLCRPLYSPLQVERRQEGDHSLVHRASSLRRVGGAYVSMLLRMPEILRVFQRGLVEDEVARFMCEFVRVLNPDHLAKRLGFFKHPLYLAATREEQSYQELRKLSSIIMYSLDIVAQHSKQEAKKKRRMRQHDRKARVIEKWQASKRPHEPLSADLVERQALADHTHTAIANQPRTLVLSVPAGDSLPLRTLHTSLAAANCEAPVTDKPALQLDVEAEPGPAPAPQPDITFFQVVPARVDRQKLMPLPAAHARRLSKHELCVTRHQGRRLGAGDDYIVAVEASRATSAQGPVAVLSVCDANLVAIRDGTKQWIRRKSSSFIREDVPDDGAQGYEQAVQKLVACRAFPSTGQVLQVARSDFAMLQQLESLRRLSIVQCLQEGSESDSCKWCFTVLGASKLRAATHVRCPEPAPRL